MIFLNLNKIDQPIIHIHFREYKMKLCALLVTPQTEPEGLMLRFLILNKLTQADGLKLFNFETMHSIQNYPVRMNGFVR